MQTEDLILWVDKAIELRESSYVPPPKEPRPKQEGLTVGKYEIPSMEALNQTRPEQAKDYDLSIAIMLVGYSNDITDWKKQIIKTRTFGFLM